MLFFHYTSFLTPGKVLFTLKHKCACAYTPLYICKYSFYSHMCKMHEHASILKPPNKHGTCPILEVRKLRLKEINNVPRGSGEENADLLRPAHWQRLFTEGQGAQEGQRKTVISLQMHLSPPAERRCGPMCKTPKSADRQPSTLWVCQCVGGAAGVGIMGTMTWGR